MKTQLLKLHIDNRHLVAKGVEVEKVIKKVKVLQQDYNELNEVHFKSHDDLKALQTNYDQLMKDYGKMESINVQQEKTLVQLEHTCLQQWKQLTKVNINMENCTHELQV